MLCPAYFNEASFLIPVLNAFKENTTDENEMFEFAKISDSSEMREYLENLGILEYRI